MRQISDNEVSQVSGGLRWSISRQDIMNAIYGDRTPPTKQEWESPITTPSNSDGMGEVIGNTIIYTALAVAILGLGTLRRLSN